MATKGKENQQYRPSDVDMLNSQQPKEVIVAVTGVQVSCFQIHKHTVKKILCILFSLTNTHPLHNFFSWAQMDCTKLTSINCPIAQTQDPS